MIIMKFGGTSVEDAAALENVCGIVAQHAEHPPFVVLSACAGVTNKLIEAVRTAAEGDAAGGSAILEELRHRHLTISKRLLRGGRHAVDAQLNEEFDLLDRLAQSVAVLREVTPRTLDQFAASGRTVVVSPPLIRPHRARCAGIVAGRTPGYDNRRPFHAGTTDHRTCCG